MGNGIGVKCRSCDYTEKFKLGCGKSNHRAMQLQRNNDVLAYVATKQEKDFITKLIRRKHGRVFDFKEAEDVNTIIDVARKSLSEQVFASDTKIYKSLASLVKREEVNCIEIPERAKDYGYMLCRCPECNKMFSRFMFSIQTTDGFYSHTHLCPDCNCALEIIRPVSTAYDFSDCVCPVCKNRTLEAVPWLIKWD